MFDASGELFLPTGFEGSKFQPGIAGGCTILLIAPWDTIPAFVTDDVFDVVGRTSLT